MQDVWKEHQPIIWLVTLMNNQSNNPTVQAMHLEGELTLLDLGCLPVEELAILASREGKRPRPIYQTHRWFARRFGSAFRALLTAANSPPEADFWTNYYQGVDWHGKTVLDPFVGGGTSIIEALRLGANVIGVDVDAVARAVTHFETRLPQIPDLLPALKDLKQAIGQKLASYYQTTLDNGEVRDVLHYFWVQVVDCRDCGQTVEAHPHYQLAYEAEGSRQWVFCPQCHGIQVLDCREKTFHCTSCNLNIHIESGPVHYGTLTCPHCGIQERLIDVATRTGEPPQWRLFALETLEPPFDKKSLPLAQRYFRPATLYDWEVFETARQALQVRRQLDGLIRCVPERLIPQENRADSRPVSYGYIRYRELFNDRQLLHLSYLAEAINQVPQPIQEAIVIAFSDHLTTNCMLTHYAFGWRRLAPLFSVRAYRHVTRPVEVNPWLDGTGRGTFPNAVRKVQRAINWFNTPKEPLLTGGFCPVEQPTGSPTAQVLHRNSKDLSFLQNNSIDLVLTDPPYFDNIAYSELSDFFLPWLQQFGLAPTDGESMLGLRENLAAKDREDEAILHFQESLTDCLSEVARVLKPTGRLVFTYQHQTAGAWYGLARALAGAGFMAIQLFPLLGDSAQGLHKHTGNSKWDAVFVMIKGTDTGNKLDLVLNQEIIHAARNHYFIWVQRLKDLSQNGFEEADRYNFYKACLVAAALGLFQPETTDHRTESLKDLLIGPPPVEID